MLRSAVEAFRPIRFRATPQAERDRNRHHSHRFSSRRANSPLRLRERYAAPTMTSAIQPNRTTGRVNTPQRNTRSAFEMNLIAAPTSSSPIRTRRVRIHWPDRVVARCTPARVQAHETARQTLLNKRSSRVSASPTNPGRENQQRTDEGCRASPDVSVKVAP